MQFSGKTIAMAVAAVLLAAAAPVFAATTGTLTIQGTVDPTFSITVTGATGYSSLSLTTVVTKKAIATIVEKSNNAAGYTVTLNSVNKGALKGAIVTNADALNYTLQYGGVDVTLDAATGNATLSDVSTVTPGAGTSKSLTISYDASTSMLTADTYSDTLTFTMTAK